MILLRLMLKEKPNGISKMPMAESLTCGTFVGFLVILPPPTLALVLCHLACCVGFVFFHVALLLCCLGLLSRCICCCAPPLCYVASLFCFFFSFFGLYQLIASSFLFPQFFTCFFIQFLLDSSLSLCFLPPLKVCFCGFCASFLYMFFFTCLVLG